MLNTPENKKIRPVEILPLNASEKKEGSRAQRPWYNLEKTLPPDIEANGVFQSMRDSLIAGWEAANGSRYIETPDGQRESSAYVQWASGSAVRLSLEQRVIQELDDRMPGYLEDYSAKIYTDLADDPVLSRTDNLIAAQYVQGTESKTPETFVFISQNAWKQVATDYPNKALAYYSNHVGLRQHVRGGEISQMHFSEQARIDGERALLSYQQGEQAAAYSKLSVKDAAVACYAGSENPINVQGCIARQPYIWLAEDCIVRVADARSSSGDGNGFLHLDLVAKNGKVQAVDIPVSRSDFHFKLNSFACKLMGSLGEFAGKFVEKVTGRVSPENQVSTEPLADRAKSEQIREDLEKSYNATNNKALAGATPESWACLLTTSALAVIPDHPDAKPRSVALGKLTGDALYDNGLEELLESASHKLSDSDFAMFYQQWHDAVKVCVTESQSQSVANRMYERMSFDEKTESISRANVKFEIVEDFQRLLVAMRPDLTLNLQARGEKGLDLEPVEFKLTGIDQLAVGAEHLNDVLVELKGYAHNYANEIKDMSEAMTGDTRNVSVAHEFVSVDDILLTSEQIDGLPVSKPLRTWSEEVFELGLLGRLEEVRAGNALVGADNRLSVVRHNGRLFAFEGVDSVVVARAIEKARGSQGQRVPAAIFDLDAKEN